MNSKRIVILSILCVCVVFNACPSNACLKKLKSALRGNGKEELPAELHPDDASLVTYSNSKANNYYMEIVERPNKTIIVRELDHPPIAMNQVVEVEEKEMVTEEPDAEYININETASMENETVDYATELAKPPERTAEMVSVEMVSEETTEIPLSPEDENIRREWNGNCTTVDWNRCNKIRQIVVLNVSTKIVNNEVKKIDLDLDCLLEPILCLTNGWTANRCHILCMAAQCNKALFFDWDSIVDFEGPCRYRK